MRLSVIAALLLAGCAEQPPYEPPLNKLGDQAKRTGTLLVRGSTATFHEWIPVDANLSLGGLDIKLSEVIFNSPLVSSTEARTLRYSSK